MNCAGIDSARTLSTKVRNRADQEKKRQMEMTRRQRRRENCWWSMVDGWLARLGKGWEGVGAEGFGEKGSREPLDDWQRSKSWWNSCVNRVTKSSSSTPLTNLSVGLVCLYVCLCLSLSFSSSLVYFVKYQMPVYNIHTRQHILPPCTTHDGRQITYFTIFTRVALEATRQINVSKCQGEDIVFEDVM